MKYFLIGILALLGAGAALLVGGPERALDARARLPQTAPAAQMAYHAAHIFTKPDAAPAKDAWLLVANGKVTGLALTADELPPLIEVVELGEQVIVPGLVAADSSLSGGQGQSDHALGAHRQAIDNFDPWADWSSVVRRGVTTVYLAPDRSRLIGGRGAVVKTAGDNRVLSSRSDLRVNTTAEIASTPPFFRPPVPPTAENPVKPTDVQPASSVAGALMVLREQTAYRNPGSAVPGAHAVLHGRSMREFFSDKSASLRVVAREARAIRGAVEIARQWGKQLVIQGGTDSPDYAADAHFIFEIPLFLSMPDLGPDWQAPDWDLAWASGLSLIPGTRGRWTWLLEAARSAVGFGLAPEQALAAITTNPAQQLGVGNRVGSLQPGFDADFIALSAHPLDPAARVNRVWIDGEEVWNDAEAKGISGGTVLRAGTVWSGDRAPLRGGAEVLLQNGKIVAVGHQVPHPNGARIVDSGPDAHITPGFIDSAGSLGLTSRGQPDPAVTLGLLAAGSRWNADWTQVAEAGVTTMVLSPTGGSANGIRTQAVKTSAGVDDAFVHDHDIVFFDWTGGDHVTTHDAHLKILEGGKKYADKWVKWREEYAAWEEKNTSEQAKQRADSEASLRLRMAQGVAADKAEDEAVEDDSETDGEEQKQEEVDPINGLWEATIEHEMLPEPVNILMRVNHDGPRVVILLSSPDFPEVPGEEVEGEWDGKNIHIELPTELGTVQINGELDAPDHMNISVVLMGLGSVEFEAFRTEVGESGKVIASTKKLRKKDEGPAEPDKDWKQEGLRSLFEGRAMAIVRVNRADEIQDAMDLFKQFELPLQLSSANAAAELAEKLKDEGVGVVLSAGISREDGRDYARAAVLHQAGVRTSFKSDSAGGARFLPRVLAMAVSNGLGSEQALAGVTWQAAEMLGIDHRVGRLAAGLDADVVVLDGPPFDVASKVLSVWVNGEEVNKQ